MSKWDKIKNLRRLNKKYQILIIRFLIKTTIGVKPSEEEKQDYIYYNFLIQFNGYLIEDLPKSLVASFCLGKTKVVKLRKYPSSDFNVFKQVFYWKEYLPVVRTFQEHFKPDSGSALNIMDCGSNIGLTSLFFLDFFPNSRIIAIEPETNNFKNLCFNLDNATFPNVVQINGAIWNKNTRLKIVNDFRDKSDWSFRVEETEEVDSIEAFSISQIMTEHSMNFIDILKIDIEGSEKELFTGRNANLDFLSLTKCLAMEIHDEFNCREKIYEILEGNGFNIFHSGELTIACNQNLKTSLSPVLV